MVEDGFHILLTCKTYQAERNEFFTKINSIIVPFESLTSQEQFLFLMTTNLYSLQNTNIVTTGGTYMISRYVSIIVVKFTMGEQQKIYNDI